MQKWSIRFEEHESCSVVRLVSTTWNYTPQLWGGQPRAKKTKQMKKGEHPLCVCLVSGAVYRVRVCAPAGGRGAWEAPGPGPGSGRSREEQHAAGPDPLRGGGQEAALPAHARL